MYTFKLEVTFSFPESYQNINLELGYIYIWPHFLQTSQVRNYGNMLKSKIYSFKLATLKCI